MRRFLVYALVVSIGLQNEAHSQTPLEKIQNDVAGLKEQAQSTQQAQSEILRTLATILAKQVAGEAKPDKETAQKKAADAESRGLSQDLVKSLEDPTKFNALEPSVASLVQKCVGGAAKAKVTPENFNFKLEGCSQKDIDNLKEGLLKQESDAVATFSKCRSVVASKAGEYESLLPRNINDVDPKKLSALGSYPDPDVRKCAEDIDRAARQITQAKDAKALLSTALTMAANVCFASGGNPYVCGAMLFVAILMSIFDGSGGGKGKGPGDGDKDTPTGSGSTSTISVGPSREGDLEKEVREKTADQAINRGPSENLATPGGDPDVTCQGVPTGQIRCRLKSKPGSERFFGGDPLLTRVARNPGPGLVVVCKGGSGIKGIAVRDGDTNNYSAFGYTRELQQEPIAKLKTSAEACNRIVD
ncbi:hypothetical protein ACLBXO_01860 [Methylobacterium sp. C33D]